MGSNPIWGTLNLTDAVKSVLRVRSPPVVQDLNKYSSRVFKKNVVNFLFNPDFFLIFASENR